MAPRLMTSPVKAPAPVMARTMPMGIVKPWPASLPPAPKILLIEAAVAASTGPASESLVDEPEPADALLQPVAAREITRSMAAVATLARLRRGLAFISVRNIIVLFLLIAVMAAGGKTLNRWVII